MKTIELTIDQQRAVDGALSCLRGRNRKLFRIAGYAGTGKTTLVRAILHEAPLGAVCAFTGKAASVLRSKGLEDAQTIHRTIYRYDKVLENFVLKQKNEILDAGIRYFLLDEASMVATQEYKDLASFGLPIIAVGDPGQLEPIGDDPRLMHNADITLTEIHRQDADSGIIQYATHVRHGKPIGSWRDGHGDVEIGGKSLFWDSMEFADVLLCGFNRTRVKANRVARDLRLGAAVAKKNNLVEGDKVVCLENRRELAVYNGEMFTISKIYRDKNGIVECDLIDNEQSPRWNVNVSTEALHVANPDKSRWYKNKDVMYIDYGYCMSVHKFQGSEAANVAVMHEQCDLWCPIRHSYTAITRASRKLRYAI